MTGHHKILLYLQMLLEMNLQIINLKPTIITNVHIYVLEILTEIPVSGKSIDWDEIVGTIAGDDTVMCAIRTVEDTKKLVKRLENILK